MRGLSGGLSRVLGVVALCAALAGCGSTGSVGGPPGDPTSGASVSATAAGPDLVQRVALEASDSLFHPASINAHTGTIEITVKNSDTVLHNLTVAVGSGVGLDTIRGGTSGTMRFTVDRPGQYRFFCTYHQGLGMTGELNVR